MCRMMSVQFDSGPSEVCDSQTSALCILSGDALQSRGLGVLGVKFALL